ncbi:TorF family putative porin [Janthinobacterium fluminis]|uniref:TorF family putative porin n=1 Tax=Janthinobacterium fluminis TaxID=2987524 RepID=A0ABT5JVC1_9BURK|nr:TorF family putative porin [Janthinobacterium fluminis]MDC8756669.1 TorF family putative porin [Janthinobacterium fluminis]
MHQFAKQFMTPLCLSLCGFAAQAQDAADKAAEAAAPLTANVSVVSQYISRGFRQSWGKPALQGGVDYAHPSGFSLGTWLSTVSDRYLENATVEWDVYGGYAGTLDNVGYNATLYYYKYPGAAYGPTAIKYDYGELSAGLSYKILYAKYNYTVSKDFFGIQGARGTGYLDIGANVDLGAGYTLNLHAGNGRVAGAGNAIWNWRDVKVGVAKVFDGGWTVAAAYTKAKGASNAYDAYTLGIPNASGALDISNPAAATVVFSLTKTF